LDSFGKQFSIIHRQTAINTDRALKKLGIPYGQFMFILCIYENEGLSQEKLSSELQMDKGFVARTVKNLEEEGFVRRVPSPDDRRQNELYPTEKAKQVYPRIIDTLRRQERLLVGNLSDEERHMLQALLDKIIRHL